MARTMTGQYVLPGLGCLHPVSGLLYPDGDRSLVVCGGCGEVLDVPGLPLAHG